MKLEWMLTEEEMDRTYNLAHLGLDKFAHHAIAKAQARKILEWLNQPCPHAEPMTLTTRRECDKCMEYFQKEVEIIK